MGLQGIWMAAFYLWSRVQQMTFWYQECGGSACEIAAFFLWSIGLIGSGFGTRAFSSPSKCLKESDNNFVHKWEESINQQVFDINTISSWVCSSARFINIYNRQADTIEPQAQALLQLHRPCEKRIALQLRCSWERWIRGISRPLWMLSGFISQHGDNVGLLFSCGLFSERCCWVFRGAPPSMTCLWKRHLLK